MGVPQKMWERATASPSPQRSILQWQQPGDPTDNFCLLAEKLLQSSIVCRSVPHLSVDGWPYADQPQGFFTAVGHTSPACSTTSRFSTGRRLSTERVCALPPL